MDPKQPDKVFYSYYNAYQLNKILFQTQNYNDKRLLHRLFVLNPLTNADIIGDVEYFRVETVMEELPLSSPVHPHELSTPRSAVPNFPPSPTSPTAPDQDVPEEAWTHMHHVVTVENSDNSDIPHEPAQRKETKSKLRIQTQPPDRDTLVLDQGMTSPLQRGKLTVFGQPVATPPQEEEKGSSKRCMSFQNALAAGSPSFEAWVDTLPGEKREMIQVWHAIKFGTDEDFLRKQPVRHFFRKNALAPEDMQLYQMPDIVDEGLVEGETPEETRVRRAKCSVM
jgi:Domain of unknown function (DUF5092)